MFKHIAVLCGCFLLGVGLTATFKTRQTFKTQQENPRDRSISTLVRRTKNQGKTKVLVPGWHYEYPGGNMGLDEALQNYSAVVVEPIESKTYIGDSLANIITAYKFRIVEAISQKNAVFCNSCPPIKDVSNKFQPALSNEFILALAGGTVTVDGVEVTEDSDFPSFENNKRYLLFVSLTPGGMAKMAAGPSGVFQITPDESFEARCAGHRIPDEIGTRFSNSLVKFRQVKD